MHHHTGSLDDRLVALRDALKPMLRPAPARDDTTDIWQEIIDIQNFVFDLGAESLQRIRLHTHLFTSYAPRSFVRLNNDGREPESYPPVAQYQFYTESLPKQYWLSEPLLPGCEMPSGLVWDGHHINPDVARYQGCLANLHHSGVLGELVASPSQVHVVEIGGGFGGLAEGLFSVLPEQSWTYVIVDLAEMLIFAGAHIMTHCPDVEVYVCESADDLERIGELPPGRRLVLVPTSLDASLSRLPEIDLIVAMASFQEMGRAEIETYLAELAQRCAGYMYSDNTEGHPDNDELQETPLSALLEQHWTLHPRRDVYEELRDGRLPWFHRPYLATPASRDDARRPTGSIAFIGGNNKKGRRYRYDFDEGEVVTLE